MVHTEADYKKLREAWVSDHYGGSLWEIHEVTLVAPAAVLLWSILQARQRYFDPYGRLAYLVDFLLNACGILFAATVYADNPVVLNGLLILPAIAMYMNQPVPESRRPPKKPAKDPLEEEDVDVVPVKPFVTSYRGAMMIITCVCILAVDFPVFPRRFAKTETLGTSLMDLGVGSFVFSAGVISVRQQLKEEDDPRIRKSFLQRLTGSMRSSIPLLAMGLVRLYSVKSLDYAEHVSEYGVHWNFFFTLAAIPPFVAIFHSIFRLVPNYAFIGYTISVLQQTFFVYSDLLIWAVTSSRTDWVSSNKEGLVSLPGYLAIFLCGQGIGMKILRRDESPLAPETEHDHWVASALGGEEKLMEMKRRERRFAIISLAKWTLIWSVTLYFTIGFYGPRLVAMRRFANNAYIVWVAAFNCGQLLLFCAIESLLFPNLYSAKDKATELERAARATSKVLHAFNRNGFAIFLLANLLTGAINMSMRTIETGDIAAMTVLVSYMGILTAVALALDHYNISIKL